jgi:hypothetical protein
MKPTFIHIMILMSKVQDKLRVGIWNVPFAVCTHGLHHISCHCSGGENVLRVLQQCGCDRGICLHIYVPSITFLNAKINRMLRQKLK